MDHFEKRDEAMKNNTPSSPAPSTPQQQQGSSTPQQQNTPTKQPSLSVASPQVMNPPLASVAQPNTPAQQPMGGGGLGIGQFSRSFIDGDFEFVSSFFLSDLCFSFDVFMMLANGNIATFLQEIITGIKT